MYKKKSRNDTWFLRHSRVSWYNFLAWYQTLISRWYQHFLNTCIYNIYSYINMYTYCRNAWNDKIVAKPVAKKPEAKSDYYVENNSIVRLPGQTEQVKRVELPLRDIVDRDRSHRSCAIGKKHADNRTERLSLATRERCSLLRSNVDRRCVVARRVFSFFFSFRLSIDRNHYAKCVRNPIKKDYDVTEPPSGIRYVNWATTRVSSFPRIWMRGVPRSRDNRIPFLLPSTRFLRYIGEWALIQKLRVCRPLSSITRLFLVAMRSTRI